MKAWARRFLMIGVILLSLILVGCGTLETLVQKDGTSSTLSDWIGTSGDKNASVPTTATPLEGKTVALYFADSTGKYLEKEERVLPKTLSLARETVTQWLKGPTAKGLQSSVSEATTLLDIAIKDNVVIVDLSKEFLKSNSKVSPEVALYGLVNTLTQFSTINQVQIRIEGKPITKYGAIDATQLKYKAALVKGAASEPTTNSNGSSNNGSKTGSNSDNSNNNTGLGSTAPSGTSNGALPDSPSSINLFNFPPTST